MYRVAVNYTRDTMKGDRYVLSLTVSCCPSFPSGALHFIREHQRRLHFLFPRGVTTILLVGGQGVADQDSVHLLYSQVKVEVCR